jgi:chromosome partitioning protein
MRTICIANHKGGCGKTTTAINLGACLAERGARVVLIDLDPQGHATVGLNVSPAALSTTIWDAFTRRVSPSDILNPILPGLDLVPSGLSSGEEEGGPDPKMRKRSLERFLKELERERPETDFVLMDCPPSIGPLTHSILWTAREALLTVEASFFALHGVGRILSEIRSIDLAKSAPTRVRVLATLYDRRTRFAKEILKDINAFFGDALYDTVIRHSVRLREATSHGVPITVYGRRTSGYRDYMDLAIEVAEDVEIESVANRKEERSHLSGSAHVVGAAGRRR